MSRATARRQRGFALPAAVVGTGIFALVAVSILDWGRGTTALLQARAVQARLAAAAEAGVTMAIHGVAIEDRTRRWPVGGAPRTMAFDGVALTIVVTDERGRIPLNSVEPEVIRALLAHAGVDGMQLDELADAVEDWMDEDDSPRLHGAEREDYGDGTPGPRNGPFRSLGEIAEVRGMTPAVLARIAPLISLTPRADIGVVDQRHASADVISIMNAGAVDGFSALVNRREEEGQRVAIEIADDEPIALRLVHVQVTARLGNEAALTREAVVEFTGAPNRPYWIRAWQ